MRLSVPEEAQECVGGREGRCSLGGVLEWSCKQSFACKREASLAPFYWLYIRSAASRVRLHVVEIHTA